MGLLDNKLSPRERIEVINAVRGKLPIDYSTEMTIIPVEFEEQSSRIPVILPEREAVNSFFEDYYAARGMCRIIYKTTAEWDADPDLIAKKEIIYVYLDADSYVDEVTGETVYVPAIKLGDNESRLIDLPMMTASTSSVVMQHLEDQYMHCQPGEREALYQALDNKPDWSELYNYIEINEPQGTFDPEDLSSLIDNRLLQISYDGALYTYVINTNGTYRYMSVSDDPNEAKFIDVNPLTGAYSCTTAINQVLDDHIKDQVRHITASERTFWNNKINCVDTVSEERLILNRN